MSDQVQTIKERLNIVDVIGGYVKLTKAGKNYKGLSPFNQEKTPSFYVSPDKGMYYDFSSGQGGDIFSFIEKIEGVDFKGALRILAEKAGIELRYEGKGDKDERERLYSLLEETTRFFETKLLENKDACTYLQDRGLEESTMRSFRLGFAPNDWQILFEFLKAKKYSERDIEKAGLIKKGEKGRYYDRFRSRIMFPIFDTTGRVIAFSGRIFGEPTQDPKNAKYINSPETVLFDKSRILYGFHKAKQSIRKYDFTILVEGQMDLVMSHQAGFSNTVAASGTGLTQEHLQLIERISKRLVMAFDADPAGIASNGRAATLALLRDFDVKVARVPLGKDPADCIREDVALWKDSVRNAKHVVDFYIDIVLKDSKEKGFDQRKTVLSARDTVLPYIQMIRSSTDKAFFIRSYANIFGIAENAVWDEVRLLERQNPVASQTQNSQAVGTHQKKDFSRKNDLEEALAGFLFWQETMEPKILEEEYILSTSKEFQIPLESILSRYSEKKDALLFKAEIAYEKFSKPHEIVRDLMRDLALLYTSFELEQIAHEQRNAEREGDIERREELAQRVYELTKFRSTLG